MVGRGGAFVFLLLATLVLAPGVVVGQPSDVARAKAAYTRASRLFKAKRFRRALPLFQDAYVYSNHRPSTVLGLAQCERQLRLYDDALEHYREYLEVEPNPAPAEEAYVRKSIEFLEAIIAARAEVRAVPALPVPPAPDPIIVEYTRTTTVTVKPPFYESYWFWTVVGLVVVGAGVTAGVLATQGEPELFGGNTGVVARP